MVQGKKKVKTTSEMLKVLKNRTKAVRSQIRLGDTKSMLNNIQLTDF